MFLKLCATLKNWILTTTSLCLCVCVPCKRFFRNYYSPHHQTWYGDFLRHENALRVNYIDLDLHWRSQLLITKIISVWLFQTVSAMPIKFAVKIVRLKIFIIFSVWWPCSSPKVTTQIWHLKNLYYDTNSNITEHSSYGIQTWHDCTLIYGIWLIVMMQGHSGSAKAKKSVLNDLDN